LLIQLVDELADGLVKYDVCQLLHRVMDGKVFFVMGAASCRQPAALLKKNFALRTLCFALGTFSGYPS
jgi:hypothetical protein